MWLIFMKLFLLRWGPAFALMLIIFIVSAQPKTELPDFGVWDFVVKKGAHVIEYALLAILMWRGVRGDQTARPAHIAWAFALTVLYAMTDEYHQTFVPGRMGHWPDVVVDALGATTGLTLRHWPRLRARLRFPFRNKSGSCHR